MKVELHEIAIKDVVADYVDKGEDGVFAYGGALSVRPAYQREFVYKDAQRDAVIHTVRKGFPLNIMYWAKNADGSYEVLDGQQRTISICEYFKGAFSSEYQCFHNLTEEEKAQILGYKLMVYVCEGTDREKLDWFKVINIAGEKLTDQELRNSVYTGPWLSDAKRHFSKQGCPAQKIGASYMSGKVNRQAYLETALKWISSDNIEDYMSCHQIQPDADELWVYFQKVINWAKVLFPTYRQEMQGVAWGFLYNECKDKTYSSKALEDQVTTLMQDEDVTDKKGIYSYVLTGSERHLSIRAFTPNQRREAYDRQKGVCAACTKTFELADMQADHITPWHAGGRTIASNCQMLCKHCNRIKSGI